MQRCCSRSPVQKPKVVVVMGPTGSGKSKLAIDLASHFPVEIINADSMQVYRGLNILTNKVPLEEQKGVPHHLLGSIDSNTEFTAKDFRDSAVPIIYDIESHNCLPVIVGGTIYYIQALVSSFLLDDNIRDTDGILLDIPGDGQMGNTPDFARDFHGYTHESLRNVDPVAADRIHPNNQRKITQYLNLYARSGILPSKLLQGKASERWAGVGTKFDCCFICTNASKAVLDQRIERRVEKMVESGLLDEVRQIRSVGSDYTRGLLQAIGVREFKDAHFFAKEKDESFLGFSQNLEKNENSEIVCYPPCSDSIKIQLDEAVEKMKMNTKKLAQRQRRRIRRLQSLYGWNIHYVDATCCTNDAIWEAEVVQPSVKIIKSFLAGDCSMVKARHTGESEPVELQDRDLWTLRVCNVCGDKELRGSLEWEQHRQGRAHRKRISRIKKLRNNVL